jgi:prepilin-type N-terminal cleavage/methylation domain-containing protein
MIRADRQTGLTLIELLVVIVIGTVLSGAILMTWFSLSDSYSFTARSSEAQDFARDAVARMARELRDAEGTGGDVAVQSADSGQITFTTTFNEEGNESRLVEPVETQYYFSEGSIHRVRDGVDRVVVDNVLNEAGQVFTYDYVDVDGDSVRGGTSPDPTMLATISVIHINLVVDLNPLSAPQPMDVSTSAHLRNQGLD